MKAVSARTGTGGSHLPRRGNPFTRWLGRVTLATLGWQLHGRLPDQPRLVAVGAPHSSNWDFVVVMAAAFALGLEVHWLGKHTLFRPPLGTFMRWLGGIPVDRSMRSGVVNQSADAIRSREQMILCIAPEGTRSQTGRWKTGFYHIARQAKVPILLCYLDNARRVLGLGPVVAPTGDLDADLSEILGFYRRFRGRCGNGGRSG